MFEAIMQISIYLAMVLLPVLIPAAFHVFYIARDRRQSYQNRAVRMPRAAAYPRMAVPAAA